MRAYFLIIILFIAACSKKETAPVETALVEPSWVVTTFAGSGEKKIANGTGTAASFYSPSNITIDAAGNLYVAEGSLIRKITPAGVVTTIAGSSTTAGYADGIGTAALFQGITGIFSDKAGNIYVADLGNYRIRKVNTNGTVTTIAGSGAKGTADGTGTAASFTYLAAITLDANDNLYVIDDFTKIRKVTPSGVVTTLSVRSATGTGAPYFLLFGLTTDLAGNIYVCDSNNNLIKKITPDGVASTLAGTANVRGSADGVGTAASFDGPFQVATDAAGNVYVSEAFNNKIRKITPGGVVTTIAGNGMAGATNGSGASASFNHPYGIAVDMAGNIYVADAYNNLIRKITFK
ncbi:NHL repeat-containing protein [Mucilaginibacter puniceus]